MLFIALVIRLESPGPTFFRQKRIGKNGKPFYLLKFRKMMQNMSKQGPMLTGRFDPRLTQVGRFLERTKLDELPQLFNVLRGDMSVVGPRPEVPKFTQYYEERWEIVLTVKPGLIGLNQVYLRNESELFPPDCEDVEQYYIDSILPDKLEVDIEYIRRRNVLFDLRILLQSIWVTIFGTVTWRSFESMGSYISILAIDTGLAGLSYVLSNFVRFGGEIPPENKVILVQMLVPVYLIRGATFMLYGTPRQIPGYFSFHEVGIVLRSLFIGSLLILGFAFLTNLRTHSRAIFMIDTAFLAVLLLGYRWLWTWLKQTSQGTPGKPRIVLVGVNDETVWAIETFNRLKDKVCDIVGVVDTDSKRRGHRIAGVEIIGLAGEMDLLLNVYDLDAVLIVRSALSPRLQTHIEHICTKYQVSCMMLPELLRTIETAVTSQPPLGESGAAEMMS